MRWDPLAMVLGVLALVWGAAYIGWRWSLKRLGLDTPDAPDMGQRERTVRRSLRALLAFDFFVLWPFALPTCALFLSFMFDERGMIGPSLAGVLGLVGFSVAVPSLIRTLRELERQRLLGLTDTVPPSFWIDGGAAAVSRPRTGGARLATYALVGALVVVRAFDWRMAIALVFYGAIFAVVRAGWKMVTRRRRA